MASTDSRSHIKKNTLIIIINIAYVSVFVLKLRKINVCIPLANHNKINYKDLKKSVTSMFEGLFVCLKENTVLEITQAKSIKN